MSQNRRQRHSRQNSFDFHFSSVVFPCSFICFSFSSGFFGHISLALSLCPSLSLSLPHCQATKRDLEKRHRTREVGDTQHEKSFCPRDTKQVDQRRQSFWSFGSTLEEKGRSMSLHTKLRAPKNVQPNMGMCAVCVSCHSLRVFASFQDSLATVG